MNDFDQLHPALTFHIVNSMGWRSLRPLQQMAVGPVLDGKDALLLAPTAGGKTEAAMFPLFSRMMDESWSGLSVLYLCPIKALLNNLHHRLDGYARLLGRSCGLWHGDIGASARRGIRQHPPDMLLTTPESLEVMLVSRSLDHRTFFAGVRAVVVDEIHAFAGDDRGWHLLALLARIGGMARQRPQRLGLSATVGNPDQLLAWLAPDGDGVVLDPGLENVSAAEVRLDFVASVANAALVISRLHAGEKRLVFCDSRSQVETLATALRVHGVRTHVSHSSLSPDERAQAERAFSEGRDCVIVATSTLELGLDVGDLDRVIQVDAPHSVASFLQRIGRTGRRPGTRRNCLFLATTDEGFLRAAALLKLWGDGFVEPIMPPALPFHLLAQQLMALALQEGGIGSTLWFKDLAEVPAFAQMRSTDRAELLRFMLQEQILYSEGGLISMGLEGEKTFGYRNFMELFSIFTSPPVFRVLYGREEIGQVHQSSFNSKEEKRRPTVLALAGRAWKVSSIDWRKRVARVRPVTEPGRSRWLGSGRPMHGEMARAVEALTTGQNLPESVLTRRGTKRLEELRTLMGGHRAGQLVKDDKRVTWWTYAGGGFNAAAAAWFRERQLDAGSDDYRVFFKDERDLELLAGAIKDLLAERGALVLPLNEAAVRGLKFHACLSTELIQTMWSARTDECKERERLRQVCKLQ